MLKGKLLWERNNVNRCPLAFAFEDTVSSLKEDVKAIVNKHFEFYGDIHFFKVVNAIRNFVYAYDRSVDKDDNKKIARAIQYRIKKQKRT